MSDTLIKLLALLIITAAVSITLKPHRAEYAMLLSIAASAVAVTVILADVFPTVLRVRDLFSGNSEISASLGIAIKCLGVAYLTDFAADTCRDFGQTALAAKAEFAGKCAIFALCVPIMSSILESALKFAQL